MIPSLGLKVHKEKAKKEQTKINIVRKGIIPFSDSESSSNLDDNDLPLVNKEQNIEEKKPNRIIQKSTVIESNHLIRSKPNANEHNTKPILSKRASIKNRLVQKELELSLLPQSENKPNELLNYIQEDNNNTLKSNHMSFKEDVLDIKSLTTPNANTNQANEIIKTKEKPITHYESQREKQLMEKYVLYNSDSSSDNDEKSNDNLKQKIENSKPVFGFKNHNKPSQIQSELENEVIKATKQKQLSTSKIVELYIQKDLLQSKTLETDHNSIALPDDTDIPDDLEEYEQWKIRELKRIKRQIEESEIKINSKIEIERRRNLTNDQRQEENVKLGSDATLRHFKSKINYLQKYYHKGAFFQDEASEYKEHIYNRDFNLPTWEDKIDRSSMPEIMAKRRGKLFKKGQTKYTHLTNEDTTNFDPAFRVPEEIANNLLAKSAGFKALTE